MLKKSLFGLLAEKSCPEEFKPLISRTRKIDFKKVVYFFPFDYEIEKSYDARNLETVARRIARSATV